MKKIVKKKLITSNSIRMIHIFEKIEEKLSDKLDQIIFDFSNQTMSELALITTKNNARYLVKEEHDEGIGASYFTVYSINTDSKYDKVMKDVVKEAVNETEREYNS